jgi:predicted lipoprotein with Yx(FWY)xxD motif
MPLPLLALAAAMVLPPDTPIDVQIIQEGSRYVMRTGNAAKPLYAYDRDQPGKSACLGRCAVAWPPLRVSDRARAVGRWTVIVRPDNVHQWAFDGRPVYTHASDANSVASGDDAGGVWHLLPTFPAH